MPINVVNRASFHPTVGITHGKQLTSSNTGYAGATSFSTYGGQQDNFTSSFTFEGVRFPVVTSPAWYTCEGDNLTFRNCHFQSALQLTLADNLLFENCTFTGGIGISSCYGVTFKRCRIHSGSDLVHITGDQVGRSQCRDIVFEETFIHQPNPAQGDHTDGMQVRGCDRLTLTRSSIDMGPWFQVGGQDVLNGAFFPEGGNGGNRDLILTDCYLNGGGYTVRVRPCTGAFSFTGTRFGPDAFFGQVTREDGGSGVTVTQSGNVLDVSGNPITI